MDAELQRALRIAVDNPTDRAALDALARLLARRGFGRDPHAPTLAPMSIAALVAALESFGDAPAPRIFMRHYDAILAEIGLGCDDRAPASTASEAAREARSLIGLDVVAIGGARCVVGGHVPVWLSPGDGGEYAVTHVVLTAGGAVKFGLATRAHLEEVAEGVLDEVAQ